MHGSFNLFYSITNKEVTKQKSVIFIVFDQLARKSRYYFCRSSNKQMLQKQEQER
jgi:hypothetical protein